MYKGEIVESIVDTHSAMNKVAQLIAAENYYIVFIEGVLLRGHSTTRIKKHDILERFGTSWKNSIIKVANSWQLLANHEARDIVSSI